MQVIDDLLSATHGEGRDDDLAILVVGFRDHPTQNLPGLFRRLVLTVAVSALGDQIIDAFHRFGIAQDGQVFAPDVAGEHEPEFAPILLDVENDEGGSQNVAGVVEAQRDARPDAQGPAVSQPHEIGQAGYGILHGVDRLDRRQPLAGAPLVHVGHVLFLDVAAVPQHGAAQVARGGSGVDIAPEAVLDQVRDVAGVVDVRVGEDHRVDGAAVEGQIAVPLEGFLAPALKQATFQQQAKSVDLNQVHGAGDGADRPDELDAHGCRFPRGIGRCAP